MRCRLFRFVLGAFVFAALSARVASASEQGLVLATARQFLNGVNTGNLASSVRACASPAWIIDDFPPHEWQGPTACADWARAFQQVIKQAGISDNNITLGKPWHVDITGDRAYVVVPTRYTYKQHGKPMLEDGSIFTMVMRKLPEGWRISSWAWAAH